MKHFITKLLEDPKPADPIKDHLDVHKHFTRYGKGEFTGPALKISKNKNGITISGAYEYEDELARIALDLIPVDEVEVNRAVLMAGVDYTPLLDKWGFNLKEWKAVKSTGKAKKYETKIITKVLVEKELIKHLFEKGARYFYSFLKLKHTFDDGKIINLDTKIKPPRPSKKKADEIDTVKVDFSILKIPNTEENLEMVLDRLAPDFRDELSTFTSITISNNYEINEIKFPEKKDVKSSREFRLKTLRGGNLERLLIIRKKVAARTNYEFLY